MVDRCKRAVATQLREYTDAMRGFTHNANSYLLSGFLQGLGGAMLAAVFAIYIKASGMPESVIGDAEAAVAFAAAAVCLIGTPLVAALGYRVLMVVALVLIVASRFGQAVIPTALGLVGLAFAVGLGDGFMRAVNSAFLSENSGKEERAHLFSTEFLVRVGAGFLGGLAGGFLPTLLRGAMTEVHAYQVTLVVGTAILGLGIAPMLKIREHQRPRKQVRHAYIDSVKRFRSWRRAGQLIGPQASIALGGGMVMPFIPLYLKHNLNASMAQVGMILGFSSVVTALGAFGTPVIARKFGLPKGVALMQGLSVPFLALVPLANSLPLAIGALWTRGALMNMAGPMYNQFSMEDLPDREKPLVAGWLFFSLNIMWLLGNVIGGRLMERSYTLPYFVAVVLYATGASLTYVFFRKHHAPEAVAEGTPALQPAVDAA